MIWIGGVVTVIGALLLLWNAPPVLGVPVVVGGVVLIIVGVTRPAHSAERDWRYVTWQYPDKPGTVRGFSTKELCERTRKTDLRIPTSPCYQEAR